jgi:hypothetical protein
MIVVRIHAKIQGLGIRRDDRRLIGAC